MEGRRLYRLAEVQRVLGSKAAVSLEKNGRVEDEYSFFAHLDRLFLIKEIMDLRARALGLIDSPIEFLGVPELVHDQSELMHKVSNPTEAQVLQRASQVLPKFTQLLHGISTSLTGVEDLISPIKPRTKALAKATEFAQALHTDLNHGWLRVTDLVRGSLLCKTSDGVRSSFQSLRSAPGVVIVQCKNRFAKPTVTGFRDALVTISLEGFICEVQIHMVDFNDVDTRLHMGEEYAFFRSYFGDSDVATRKWLGKMEEFRQRGLGGPTDQLVSGVRDTTDLELLDSFRQTLLDADLFDEAGFVTEQALDIARGQKGDEVGAAWMMKLASIRSKQEALPEADELLHKALEIHEKSLPPTHADLLANLDAIAEVYEAQNKLPEAEAVLRRSLAIREKSLAADHADLVKNINDLGLVLRHQAKHPEAEAFHRRALGLQEASLGRDHINVAKSLNNLALVLVPQGKTEEAEHLYRRALAIKEASLGPDHTTVANSLVNLALLLQSTKKADEARPLLERAYRINVNSLGEEHPTTVAVKEYLDAPLPETPHHAFPAISQWVKRATTRRRPGME